MKSAFPGAFLIFVLSAPLRAGQIQGPVTGDFQTGTQTGAAGATLSAPVPVQLTVPSLLTAASPALTPALAPSPVLARPIAAVSAVAAPAIPALPVSAVTAARPAALAQGPKAAPAAPAKGEAAPLDDPGRALFDQAAAKAPEAAPASGGLWGRVKNMLSLGEAAPAWPGKTGDPVRVGRIKTALDRPLGDGGTSKVWLTADRNYAVKLLHPQARALPGVAGEAATLRALAKSDLPVAKLVGESADGGMLVKEYIEGDSAHKILERGAFSRSQAEGWPELAAKLIKAGVTADLARGNLVWQHWRTRWTIVDAGGLTDGGPRQVLEQMMAPELLARAGLDGAGFLAGLRARLGPDSALWAKSVEALRDRKAGDGPLAALARRDAAAPAAPVISFGPAPKGPAGLDDAVVSGGEAVKRLGWNPLVAKQKYNMHGDDPGKLNTTILHASEPGRTPVVVKIAQWDIIRNEVALRRLARRFFGRYFRVPASVAVERGYDSFMIMEKADASPSRYADAFSREQRVAAALFLRTFGVGDVNKGNVLAAHDKGLPWIIDFEQALGRVTPVAGRLPDERIAEEMPWMSLHEHNRVEDYQPAVRAWRAKLAEPATRAAIESDLKASGFSAADAAALLARFDLNAADLDWTLQNDADFVNQFVDRSAAQR